jgi:hypothetical protein
MKVLLLLTMVAAVSCAQNTPNTAKSELTKAECHSAYQQNNSLSATQAAWVSSGEKGASPLSRYSIAEIDATGMLLSRCSAVDSAEGHINETYLELMRVFQGESDSRILKYISRHQLWGDIVKEDAAGLGRQ